MTAAGFSPMTSTLQTQPQMQPQHQQQNEQREQRRVTTPSRCLLDLNEAPTDSTVRTVPTVPIAPTAATAWAAGTRTAKRKLSSPSSSECGQPPNTTHDHWLPLAKPQHPAPLLSAYQQQRQQQQGYGQQQEQQQKQQQQRQKQHQSHDGLLQRQWVAASISSSSNDSSELTACGGDPASPPRTKRLALPAIPPAAAAAIKDALTRSTVHAVALHCRADVINSVRSQILSSPAHEPALASDSCCPSSQQCATLEHDRQQQQQQQPQGASAAQEGASGGAPHETAMAQSSKAVEAIGASAAAPAVAAVAAAAKEAPVGMKEDLDFPRQQQQSPGPDSIPVERQLLWKLLSLAYVSESHRTRAERLHRQLQHTAAQLASSQTALRAVLLHDSLRTTATTTSAQNQLASLFNNGDGSEPSRPVCGTGGEDPQIVRETPGESSPDEACCSSSSSASPPRSSGGRRTRTNASAFGSLSLPQAALAGVPNGLSLACLAEASLNAPPSPAPPSRPLCEVCQQGEACMVVLPCRHLCLCKECERRLAVCPTCCGSKSAALEISR